MNNGKIQKLIFVLIAISFCYSCMRKNILNNSLNSEKLSEVNDPNIQFELLDAEKARVTVSNPELVKDPYSGKYQVPTIYLNFSGNDFVKILRCKKDIYPQFDLSVARMSSKPLEERKWLWIDYKGEPKWCKIASNHFAGEVFSDVHAPSGDFFYVVNPCVSEDIALQKQEACSHYLALSAAIFYESKLSAEVTQKQTELADAEGRYDALIAKLLGLSRKIINNQQACEFSINHQESLRNVKAFGWDLLTAAIAVSGAFLVRGLLNTSAATRANQSFQKYLISKKAATTFAKPLSSMNKTIYTFGFFAAAWSIVTVIRNLKSNRGQGGDDPACQKIESLAAEVLSIQENRLLEQAMDEIIALSTEIHQLNEDITTYTEASFQSP